MRKKNNNTKNQFLQISVNETVAFIAVVVLIGFAIYRDSANTALFAFLSAIVPIIFNRTLRK